MKHSLPCKNIKVYTNGTSKKKMRRNKPWWNETLGQHWVVMLDSENAWLACHHGSH